MIPFDFHVTWSETVVLHFSNAEQSFYKSSKIIPSSAENVKFVVIYMISPRKKITAIS